jgi:hypothetical protein
MSSLFIPGTSINILTSVVQLHKIDVSPSVAKWLLGRSRGNPVRMGKGIREEWLRSLQGIIARGEWKASASQGGALDYQGILFNGHHRLTAISLQDKTLPMYFTIGCDPDENSVIDQGANRSLADVLSMEKKQAEVLRLAAYLHYGTAKPSPAQVAAMSLCAPLVDAHQALLDACPRAVRFFSSSPMRLAACLRIISSSSPNYVTTQWRALILCDYNAMSNCAKALARQVYERKVRVNNTYDTLARGLVVFDESKAGISKIQITDAIESVRLARTILGRLM